MYRTDWFRFHIQVRDGRITRLDPSNIPARRVRVIDHKGPERRQDLVQDVAADSAPSKQAETKPDSNFFTTGA
jgi:hypothetical protein